MICVLFTSRRAVLRAIQIDIGENWKPIIIEGESPMNINLTGLLQLLLVTSFTIESPYWIVSFAELVAVILQLMWLQSLP